MIAPDQILPWHDPEGAFLAVSRSCKGPLAFLYSSQQTGYSGRYSLLAWGDEAHRSGDWQALQRNLDKGGPLPSFGYLAYEMVHGLESVPAADAAPINLPPAWFFRPTNLLRYDHQEQKLEAWGDEATGLLPLAVSNALTEQAPEIGDITSNMNRADYMSQVARTCEAIHDGAFYQANLTRKFYGNLKREVDAALLFLNLHHVSPAPYGAYMRVGDIHVLSSSPELFLRVGENGHVETRPIKGTLRSHDGSDGERHALLHSDKDRAENLMIVDLMRNDLSRVCMPSTIDASRLFEVDSFRTVHHLSSTVTGQLAPGMQPLDVVRAAFPPGSMTGAPKIAAMRWCAGVEKLQRGIYSGALGWVDGSACEFSVVIRTLLLQGTAFEFQVGGGIVSDSEPEKEFQETLAKARGIAQALGLKEEKLALI